MKYTYIKERPPGLWSVGYYNARGDWVPLSYHPCQDAAANRAEHMNDSDRAAPLNTLTTRSY